MNPEMVRTQHSREGVAEPQDTQTRLVLDLPPQWQNETIGPAIESWDQRVEAGRRPPSLRLGGLPPRIGIELAWMAYWQFCDGSKVAVSEFNEAASVLRWAFETGRSSCDSIVDLDHAGFTRLYRSWFERRRGRLPANTSARDLLCVLFGYPRQALLARSNESAWWALDDWIPRCNPRIPLRNREPRRSEGCRPGRARIRWVRDAIKWHLGCALEAGTLTWSTIMGERTPALLLLDRWLAALDDPAEFTTNLANAGRLSKSYRDWVSDPTTRPRKTTTPATTRAVNTKLRAVVELMTFVVDNRAECHRLMGPSPWDDLTEAHAAIWRKQIVAHTSKPAAQRAPLHRRSRTGRHLCLPAGARRQPQRNCDSDRQRNRTANQRVWRCSDDANVVVADADWAAGKRDLHVRVRLPFTSHRSCYSSRGRRAGRAIPIRAKQD
jgi:hypothetical protein